MAQLIKKWVRSCKQWITASLVKNNFTWLSLQDTDEHIRGAEDALQTDLFPSLPPSGSYQNIVKAMDVFSRYLFAYPIASQDAEKIIRVIIHIINKHT